MNKQHDRLIRVSSLDIVDLDPINSHILVCTKFWVLKTGWRFSWFHCEDLAAELDEPDEESEEDSGDGEKKANTNSNNSSLVHNGEIMLG